MNMPAESQTLDQAQRIYTLTEFIKRIRIKTSAGESIEPELAQAMHYINEGTETPVSAYAELQAENERLKDLFAEVASICLDYMPIDHATLGPLDAVRRVFKDSHGLRERVADLESQLAAANEKLADERLFIRGLQEQLAAGGEAVAEVARNEAGQIHMLGSDGNCFDMSKFIGAKFYTTPQASASAASKLTDEEITELWISAGQRPRWFARAIERRTQASAGVKVPPCNDVWYWLNRMSDEDIGQTAKQWPGAAERVRQLLNADVLFASSATTAEPSRWQPIETAPGGGRAFIASGHDHGYVTKPRHYVVAFNDGRGIIDVADGKPLSYLTHWMPLPAPPSDSLGGEG